MDGLFWKVFGIFFILNTFGGVHSRSNGNVEEACDTMMPGHNNEPQTSESPFEMSVSATEYSGGDSITITISSSTGQQFKGFFVQARRLTDDQRLGTFTAADGQQLLCSEVKCCYKQFFLHKHCEYKYFYLDSIARNCS